MPVQISEAVEFVRSFHRHNRPPVSGLFSVGVSDGETLVGVALDGCTGHRNFREFLLDKDPEIIRYREARP